MLLSVGCAHSVNYKLTEADRWSGAKIEKVVRVQTFVDQTPDPEMIERPAMSDLHRPATLVEARTLQEGDYTWRLNYRSRYSNKEIANGVTKMIVKHLKHAGIFRDVVDSSSNVPADCELTGNITAFHAEGRVNKGAEGAVAAGSGFGLIGVLATHGATAGQKTEIRADIELRDVSLTDITQHQPLWIDTITISTNFVAPFEAASEPMVFVHTDNCLKQAVTEMMQRLAAYVSSASAK
jgi:hypothetical protein